MGAPVFIPRPDPLTVLVPCWTVLWGVIGAIQLGVSPPAATEVVPRPAAYAFFVGLSLLSALVLGAMATTRTGRGLRVQRGAWTALGVFCLSYGSWSIQALGARALVFALLMVTLCGASFWQARRLNAVLSQPKG